MSSATRILDVRDVGVTFRSRGGLLKRPDVVRAVDGVSLTVDEGVTLGLVGESGSGKSTLGRAIIRLLKPNEGTIELCGRDITSISGAALRNSRRDMRLIFQDPYSSLNPLLPVGRSIGEPLDVHERLSKHVRAHRVAELLEIVGLRPDHADRLPHEFSGGQRQRLAIARALAVPPKLIVCDEAVSALDVSTQNQIIDLLERLQRDLGVAYLFISHDLSVVRHVAHRVAVMYLGQIVEEGPVERVFTSPAHPYTQALLAAVPRPVPGRKRHERVVLKGDLTIDPSRSGCPLYARCPHAIDVCAATVPQPVLVPEGGSVRCHVYSRGHQLDGPSHAVPPMSMASVPPAT